MPEDQRAADTSLNCLSAGSVSLTRLRVGKSKSASVCLNCLSAGSVSLTSVEDARHPHPVHGPGLNCLSAGSVSLTETAETINVIDGERLNCLSAGSVSLTRTRNSKRRLVLRVSIAFRLGLFL